MPKKLRLTKPADEQAAFAQCLHEEDPWEAAGKIPMTRPYFEGVDALEPGVKFFILALNFLGCQTQHSCEGHPNGFYTTFTASYPMAQMIHSMGYFDVEIEGKDYWSLRQHHGRTSERDRARGLKLAAASWAKTLLKLQEKVAAREAKKSKA
jgi:hypothetical protein